MTHNSIRKDRSFFPAICIGFFLIYLGTLYIAYFDLSVSYHHFQNNAAVAIIMTLGSFVTGSTCLGGGAVAFPALTKILQGSRATFHRYVRRRMLRWS